jgi:hypothetical protein
VGRSPTALQLALSVFIGLLLASAALGQDLVIRGRCVGCRDGDSVTLLA